MGYAILPEPGTEAGPCENDCSHTDCAATRHDAATACAYCREPIGYGTEYVRLGRGTGPQGLAHFVCELKAAEERQ